MGDSWTDNLSEAANTLRAWALDENLKGYVMGSPELAAVATRIARRYTGGESIDDAVASANASMARGHNLSVEYAGESIRDATMANAETEVFLHLIEVIRTARLPSTISFDLSHVGSVVDPALGLTNARRMAAASASLGTALMISAEGSDRTDLVLDLYDQLAIEYSHVGITLQARLHRTPTDLTRVLSHPGTIRLVKGAFLEDESVAFSRGSQELEDAYLGLAARLIDSGHATSIATHDVSFIEKLRQSHAGALTAGNVEFEMLLGLAPETLDALRREGFHTREYLIFGGQWWLYVLNRIAEEPERVYDAIIAAGLPAVHNSGNAGRP